MSVEEEEKKERVPPTYESLLPCLPLSIKNNLEFDDDEIFASDFDYFQLVEALTTVRFMANDSMSTIEQRIFSSHTDSFADVESECTLNGIEMSSLLRTVREKLVEKHDSRLNAHLRACEENEDGTLLAPRLHRVIQKFNFTELEKEIFFVCIMSQVSEEGARRGMFRNFGRNGTTGLTIASMLGCSLNEVADFFDSTRLHIKEGLVPSLQHMHFGIGTSSESTISVLLGTPLTTSQFLSIESPTLASIVQEEPDFDKTKAGKGGAMIGEDYMPPPPELESQGSFLDQLRRDANQDQEETLYSLLKKEEEKEKGDWLKEQLGEEAIANMKMGGGELGEEGVEGMEEKLDIEMMMKMMEDQNVGKEGDEEDEEEDDSEEANKPFSSDLAYLQDQFLLMKTTMKLSKLKKQIEDSTDLDEDDERQRQYMGGDPGMYDPITGRMLQKEQVQQKRESSMRKQKNRETTMKKRIDQRLALTKQKGGWMPRMERLATALNLTHFEKNIIITMIGTAIAPSTVSFNDASGFGRQQPGSTKCTVNDLLTCFCSSLEEQIKSRKYFYKSAVLVKEGILNLHGMDFAGDLTQCIAEIDRRMLDFVVGLDTEFSEIVDGSHLYTPEVKVDDVILPEDMKGLIMETVQNFDTYKLVQKNLEVDKKLTYGRGMVLLFYGQSGTGKTMMANALATTLGKKVLLINFPYLGFNEAAQIIKLIFREAKIHDAILFFDECESIFMSREKGSHQVNMLLTELERHDGLSILATNRPYDLDEAMYRRITLALEFRKPDHLLRERIWQALCPPKLQMEDEVDLAELALKYELTGGFIKNSWLSALSFAVSRDGLKPRITQEDLKKGAAHQLRGRLAMVDFDRRIIPTRGLEDVILEQNIMEQLMEIVNFGKAQAILFGQWGFHQQHGTSKGIAALFYGPPGTGKTMAAEGIGYDLGKPLKVVNCAQLLSKWVGESQKNIDTVFDEAKAVDAVLVFDEAEGLFGSRSGEGDGSSRHDTMNVGVLLHHIETFPGVVIVITNLREKVDTAFFRRFKFALEFKIPNEELRGRLWRLLIPEEAPLSEDVDMLELGRRFTLTGGGIKSAVFRAASRIALRMSTAERVISMEDLVRSGEEEMEKENLQTNDYMMYS